ncbi:MAG: hypothetical protein ACRCTG_11080 [Aestuariivirga sp.]
MSTLASLLIALAAALVKVLLQQRQAANDAQAVGRLQAVQKGLLDAKTALEWKVAAMGDPAAGDLRVRDGARAVPLPGDGAGAGRAPD